MSVESLFHLAALKVNWDDIPDAISFRLYDHARYVHRIAFAPSLHRIAFGPSLVLIRLWPGDTIDRVLHPRAAQANRSGRFFIRGYRKIILKDLEREDRSHWSYYHICLLALPERRAVGMINNRR